MPDLFMHVKEKTAQMEHAPVIVCGNSDYTLHINFDSEWDAYPVKTLRAVWYSGGLPVYADVMFEGTAAELPAFYETAEVAIGVYAGNICTTVPARIPCARCITDSSPRHPEPSPDVYDQLLAYLKELETAAPAASSDVQAVSAGGVSEDIFAIAEEVS